MKHVLFLHTILSYSIGLPTLAILIFIYFKCRKRVLLYLSGLLFLATVQIAYQTYIAYHFLNIDFRFSYNDDLVNYLLFSFAIIMVPLTVNEWFQVPFRKRINLLSGGLFLIAQALILIPFLSGRLRDRYFSSSPNSQLVLVLLFFTIVYMTAVIVLRFTKVKEGQDRLFLAFSAVCLVLETSQFAFPIFQIFKHQFAVYNLIFFVWNLGTLKFVIGKYLMNPLTDGSLMAVVGRLGLTEREKEIVLLLAGGDSNRSIGERLYITEDTVKTHVKNIYRKLEVRNRVQLINLLKGVNM